MNKDKGYKPRIKTLKKLVSYLDERLHYPLSFDDMVYLRWKAEREIFYREVEVMRLQMWEELKSKMAKQKGELLE